MKGSIFTKCYYLMNQCASLFNLLRKSSGAYFRITQVTSAIAKLAGNEVYYELVYCYLVYKQSLTQAGCVVLIILALLRLTKHIENVSIVLNFRLVVPNDV